jgi:hypothetical protein
MDRPLAKEPTNASFERQLTFDRNSLLAAPRLKPKFAVNW